MYSFYADDGRILTPPKELVSLLKDSFPAFLKVLGHIRFFYMADEIWDGISLLVFKSKDNHLATIMLHNGFFNIHISTKKLRIDDEALIKYVFEILKQANTPFLRPLEQRTAHPDPNVFACGYRCDLCLGYQCYNKNEFSESDHFAYLNWVCYHNCVPGIEIEKPPANDKGIFRCSGCNKNRNKFCRSYICSREKGFVNCAECGAYHSCDVYKGSHYAAQCNLGITAEEITKLVIPYCMKERLDQIRDCAF